MQSLGRGVVTPGRVNGMAVTCLHYVPYGLHAPAVVCITGANVLALVVGVVNVARLQIVSISDKVLPSAFAVPGSVRKWDGFVGFGSGGFDPPAAGL